MHLAYRQTKVPNVTIESMWCFLFTFFFYLYHSHRSLATDGISLDEDRVAIVDQPQVISGSYENRAADEEETCSNISNRELCTSIVDDDLQRWVLRCVIFPQRVCATVCLYMFVCMCVCVCVYVRVCVRACACALACSRARACHSFSLLTMAVSCPRI